MDTVLMATYKVKAHASLPGFFSNKEMDNMWLVDGVTARDAIDQTTLKILSGTPFFSLERLREDTGITVTITDVEKLDE